MSNNSHGLTLPALIPHQYDSVSIRQRAEDGYLHATAMCKAVGRLFADYSRMDATKAYFDALSADMGIPITDLIQVRRGGIPDRQGTWVHPKVAIHLAQWLSPEFAVWCTNIIYDWMEQSRAPSAPPEPKEIEFNPVKVNRLLDILTTQHAARERLHYAPGCFPSPLGGLPPHMDLDRDGLALVRMHGRVWLVDLSADAASLSHDVLALWLSDAPSKSPKLYLGPQKAHMKPENCIFGDRSAVIPSPGRGVVSVVAGWVLASSPLPRGGC